MIRHLAALYWADRKTGAVILAAFPATYALALGACALIKVFS